MPMAMPYADSPHLLFATHRTRMTVYSKYSTLYLPAKPKTKIPALLKAEHQPALDFEQSSGNSNARQHTHGVNAKPKHKTHTGIMTKHARRVLLKAVNTLVEASPVKPVFNHVLNKTTTHHLSFITLTLPFDVDDKTEKTLYKSYLTPLIDWMKKHWNLLNYVWRAERTARGRVHYHLITDCYVPSSELRRRWNKLLSHLPDYTNYYQTNKYTDMPSTDIQGIYDPDKAGIYIAKYLSKKEADEKMSPEEKENRSKPINGRVWGCSENLKLTKRPSFQPSYATFEYILSTQRNEPDKVIFLEYSIILLQARDYVLRTLEYIERFEYREYLRAVSPPDHFKIAA